ncbi:MAG: M28 family peptidase [Sphaerochaetaceae bacterium]|nr:M28 family peptidase [Sphaerochaetaceae bacterium]
MAKVKMEKLQAARMGKNALEMVTSLIERFGSRLSGSSACLDTARVLADELRPHCDRVESEAFSLHPNAFLGWIRIMVVLYPLALICFWLSLSYIALILTVSGILIMVYEFFLYRQVIDRWFPKVTGKNVYGIIEPEHSVERTVVFSGHHDSARVFNFLTHKPHLYVIRISVGLGAYFALTLAALIQTIVHLVGGKFFSFGFPSIFFVLCAIVLTIALPWVLQLWFFASNKGTPGAGDNLISSAMAVQLARYFRQNADNGSPLRNTRVVLASFDGEEAGLRGSRDFYSRHREDATVLSKKSWNFNVDCPYNAKDLFFLTSDINGSVKLSQEMATQCVAIAKSMGFEAFSQPIAFLTGGTDAAEAAKAGLESVTRMAMPWRNVERGSVYHTPDDLPEAIDPRAIEETLSIAIRFIEQLDAQELG